MILVVGATGTLGGLVTQRLLAQGQPVRVLVRGTRVASKLASAGVEFVRGDLKDPASLAAAVEGVDAVVTTANSALRGGADSAESVDRVGNRSLIDAARQAGVGHFVFVSALGATVDSPVPFLRAKSETEAHLRASGMPYTIVAPNVFMDIWVRAVVGAPARAGQPVVLVGEGERRHSLVAIRDVAAFIVAAVAHPAALDQYLPIGGPTAVSWRDVVAAYETALGRPIALRFVPPGSPVPGLPEPMPALLASLEAYDSPVEMAALARTFGVGLTPLAALLRDDLATTAAAAGAP